MKSLKLRTSLLLLKSSVSLIGGLSLALTGLGDFSAIATTQSLIIDVNPSASPKAPVTKPTLTKEPDKPVYKVSPKSSTAIYQNRLSAPKISVPEPKSQVITPQTSSNSSKMHIEGKNNYIDANNYGINSPVTPPTVILTERQSSCRTIAQQGRLSGGNCALSPQNPVYKSKNNSRTSSRSLRQAASTPSRSVRLVSRSTSPSVTPRLQLTESTDSSLELKPVTPYNRATSLYRQPAIALALAQQTTDLLFPVPIIAEISSAFGWRQHPITQTQRFHYGTDIAAPIGTPVLASYQGQVESANWAGGYGLMVVLRHLEGTQESRYAHLSEILVEPGQWVEKGEIIGRIGSTGDSTGPHLHFEWRHQTSDGWVAVDAGIHLEYALDHLIRQMEYAQQLDENQG